MRAWFEGLDQREQMGVLALSFAVALYILYMFIWSPLHSMRDALEVQNRGVAGSLQRVDVMVSGIMHLRDSGARPGATTHGLAFWPGSGGRGGW